MAFNIARGPKDQIEAAIAAEKVAAGTFIVTSDAEDEKGNELVIVERDKTPVVITSRTQEPISVMGVNLSSEVADGKTLPAGMNLDDFIKLLVQKRIAASYTAPTISIANNGGQASATLEAGASVTVKVKSTFTQKDAGAVTSHVIKRGDEEVATGTEATLTHEETFVVVDGATNWKSTVEYAEGAIKNDNFGDASPSGHIAAGSKTSGNFTITGARKAFYGAVVTLTELTSDNIRGLAASKLAPVKGDKLTVTIAEGQQHLIVALPSGVTLTQVTYLDLGDKTMLDSFNPVVTKSVAGASEAAGNKDYNVYVYSMSSPAGAAMNFELLLA